MPFISLGLKFLNPSHPPFNSNSNLSLESGNLMIGYTPIARDKNGPIRGVLSSLNESGIPPNGSSPHMDMPPTLYNDIENANER